MLCLHVEKSLMDFDVPSDSKELWGEKLLLFLSLYSPQKQIWFRKTKHWCSSLAFSWFYCFYPLESQFLLFQECLKQIIKPCSFVYMKGRSGNIYFKFSFFFMSFFSLKDRLKYWFGCTGSSMQHANFYLWHVGSSSLTRDQTGLPALGAQSFSHFPLGKPL